MEEELLAIDSERKMIMIELQYLAERKRSLIR
jgi:hypothetical protein